MPSVGIEKAPLGVRAERRPFWLPGPVLRDGCTCINIYISIPAERTSDCAWLRHALLLDSLAAEPWR
jgi:hypothetical protein